MGRQAFLPDRHLPPTFGQATAGRVTTLEPPLMPVLVAIAALFAMQLLGELLVRFAGLPLPSPLVGMLLLLGALMVLGRIPNALRLVCRHMLAHMMLLFIPAIAGIMVLFGPLGWEWPAFLLACVGGAAFSLAVTACTLRWMLKRAKRAEA